MVSSGGYENIDWGILPESDAIRRRHEFRYQTAAEFAYGLTVDAACGFGCGSLLLADKADTVVGFDRDSNALDVAQRYYDYVPQHIMEFHCADLDKLELPPCHYLVCIETLEHLHAPRVFLAKAMSSADRIFLSVPIIPTKQRNQYHLHDFTFNEVLSWFDENWKQLFIATQEGTYGLVCYERRQ